MNPLPVFDKNPSLTYLALPENFTPSPETDPIAFLSQYLTQLPPHILLHYSYITSAKQRSAITSIRNRRLQYVNQHPPELSFEAAQNTWPDLWQGQERGGLEEGKEEKHWVEKSFLEGNRQHVGKLGNLLAGYEEEREAQRIRGLRRAKSVAEDEFVPEDDDDSEDDMSVAALEPEIETPEQARATFERLLRERFIHGLLENIEYDKVDWDETLDGDDDRDAEERWFDDDDDDE